MVKKAYVIDLKVKRETKEVEKEVVKEREVRDWRGIKSALTSLQSGAH